MPVSKDLLRLEETEIVDAMCVNIIANRQKDEYDPAHGKLHLGTVANFTDAWGAVYGLRKWQRLLLRPGGFLHDIKRSPSEKLDSAQSDEEISGKFVYDFLTDLNNNGTLSSKESKRKAVEYAVTTHGKNPWVEDPEGFKNPRRSLARKFREVLYLSDKMEQFDVTPAVLRRAMFVSGKRLEVGDMSKSVLSFGSKEDRIKAFLIESARRFTIVNPEYSFPVKVQKVIGPLYVEQRNFVHAACKSLGINSVPQLADLIFQIRNNEGEGFFYSRDKEYKSPDEVAGAVVDSGGITTDGILNISDDAARSAAETITYLSSKWKDANLKRVVDEWQPNGELALFLKNQFGKYINGRWISDIQQRILLAA